eukprot:TRINITY_DN104086_c0_g1_i1.p1 TRINITY_DN104086_c0_g1~~TRINITY_DN104086_c0_g1_i1.p1  ORF type:complete len:216 (+),score=39.27 TRINITY_DN104086_c0_g1_i1:56-703(+)
MIGRMGAAAAVRHDKNKVGYTAQPGLKRKKAHDERLKLAKQLDQLFQQYDVDHTGKLEKNELISLLTELNDNVPPTEAEINYILHEADNSEVDKCIDRKELKAALVAWKEYKKDEPVIRKMLDKYDKNNNQIFEFDELKEILTDLNDGNTPTNDEVEWVLNQADHTDGIVDGALNTTEIMVAIGLWYSHCEVVRDDVRNDGSKPGTPGKPSCTIM